MLQIIQPSNYRSGLACPAGVAPRFDPAHVAAAGVRFSGVALASAGFVNLMTGKPGVGVGAIAPIITGGLGQAVNVTSGATDKIQFSGQSTTTDASCTIAAIAQLTNGVGFHYMFSAGAGSSGPALATNGAILTFVQFGGTSTGSTLINNVAVNIPYLFVVSKTGTTAVNFLAVNLLTGQIQTDTGTVTASVSVNGTYNVGSSPGNNAPLQGYIAAAMYSSQFLSIPQLRQWAADPWSFWYGS